MRSCSENDLRFYFNRGFSSYPPILKTSHWEIPELNRALVRWEISKMVDFPAMTIMMTPLRVVRVVSLFLCFFCATSNAWWKDYRLDGEVLLPYDLKASAAHASMLQSIGVLTAEDRGVHLGGQLAGWCMALVPQKNTNYHDLPRYVLNFCSCSCGKWGLNLFSSWDVGSQPHGLRVFQPSQVVVWPWDRWSLLELLFDDLDDERSYWAIAEWRNLGNDGNAHGTP